MIHGDEVLERALQLGERGEWSEMEKVLREAVEQAPRDGRLLCWLGVAQRELGLSSMAYDTFRRCLATQPADPHVLAIAGDAVARFDDPDAEPALRLAALTAPDLLIARLNYGAYLAREGLFEDGLRELDAAFRLAPEDPRVAVERGRALALSGDLEAAADELARAVALDPADGWPRVLLGLVLLELERWDEAAFELVQGARLRETDAEAETLAALAAAAVGRDEVVVEMMERARLHAKGSDRTLVREAERRVSRGAGAARSFARTTVAPVALRERLMSRD